MSKQKLPARDVSLPAWLRSLRAVVLGLLLIVLLSLASNKLVRLLGWFPQGDPMVALIYRSVYIVLGSYLCAVFAPSRPIYHALALGGLYMALMLIASMLVYPLQFFGPLWYYLGLLITALPCAWLGGALYCWCQQAQASKQG